MKKVLLLVGILFVSATAKASLLSTIVADIEDNTKLTIVENAIPGYFYNLKVGRSEVGLITDIFQYRFLALNAGYSTGYLDNARGSIVLGGSVHLDKLARQAFPRIAAYLDGTINVVTPNGFKELWRKAFVGFCIGHSITENELQYFFVSGLEFKWGN